MAATSSPPRAPQRVGRFELKRVIGRGSQATVWLAHDPRLARDVALKLMTPQAGANLGDWLAEARHVAALNHPHIVAVFEADVQGSGADAQPYLVFEYISGAPLDRHLRTRGPFAPREAVEWLLGVLDALAQAHAAGLVHRDIKPSNLLIDAAGRARVTDFGIAVRSGVAAVAVGTPRYAAPETLRGAAPTAAVDVFALGLLLAELMLGHPLVDDAEVPAVRKRIVETDLALPAKLPQPVDDALRGVIQRALARDPVRRYADAAELRDALRLWLTPVADARNPGDSVSSKTKAGALDFLLRRMRHKTDFPALSDSVARIQRVAASENESLSSLAGEILKDVALTHKLLRLVNTAHYSQAGGSISTVSRAVALMGFAGVRNLALSLVLVEHMNDKLHAQQIKQEFLRALLAGTLAEELCPRSMSQPGAVEEAFLGAMLRNLGRLLAEFYFPEEAEQVRRLVQPGAVPARDNPKVPVPEARASQSVLGLSYEELGLGVARHWGLPETLQRCMQGDGGVPPGQPPQAAAERLRWVATAANDMADTLLQHEPEEGARRLAEVGARYARVLGVPAPDILGAVARSRVRLTELASGLEIVLRPGAPAERLMAPRDAARTPTPAVGSTGHAPADAPDTISDVALGPSGCESTLVLAVAQGRDRAAAADPAGVLAAGIQDITNSMVEDVKLGEVLRMILETMYRALGFRRVLFCLRDAKSGALVGRFMLGEGDESLRAAFRVGTRPVPDAPADLFSAVCVKGADTLIADATTASMRARLPAWYTASVDAPAFLLLPLLVKGAPVGLIYADKAEAGAIVLSEKELSLLRTLRNQAVMAFRQASGG
ncbi:MAG: HDOD domain-containing protein [Methylibium sp.]|uniref:serine/threonine protein kinase n=1 Tax=Methylibium sp. TaxID=2067992 RepID=UPI0017A6649D|nr:serine/threonine protein kinase [Methylibium sp.]MBA3595969.1 HDOD domain-containing protein [Methylibium sp.]